MRKNRVLLIGSLVAVIIVIAVIFFVSGKASKTAPQQGEVTRPTKKGAARPTYHLVIKNHHFIPEELHIPEQTRFFITIENQDDRVDEFESYDMKFERIVPPSQTRTVHGGPLHQHRSYVFFDDFHPDETRGHVVVQPRSS